jgi:hypothetical protein
MLAAASAGHDENPANSKSRATFRRGESKANASTRSKDHKPGSFFRSTLLVCSRRIATQISAEVNYCNPGNGDRGEDSQWELVPTADGYVQIL